MYKKLLVPVALMALSSVSLRAMDAEKEKQEVTGLEDITGGAFDFADAFKREFPNLIAVVPHNHLDAFLKILEKKHPGVVNEQTARARKRGIDINQGLQEAVTTVQGLQAQASAAMATAGVLADILTNVTGVDVKAVGAEAGTDIKSLVQQGVQAALAELKEAEKTDCWGRCKKKPAAVANTSK